MRITPLAQFALLGSLASAAPAQTRDSGFVTTAPGVSIYFERIGNGPQVVVVPNRLYMPEMRQLASPDRTLILYDMRNRGNSRRVQDTAQLTILGDLDDLEALRLHVRAEKMSLVGYSYLGLLVALYASEHSQRVERLVQIGPVPRRFGTPYSADQTAGMETLGPDAIAAANAWRAVRDSGDRRATKEPELCRVQARFFAFYLVGRPENHRRIPDVCGYENEWVANANRHLGHHFSDIQKRDFPRERFTGLPQRVLVVHGTMDRNAPYGAGLEWATTFPDARLITVPGAAHQLWVDDPGVLTDISAFLRGQWPARAVSFGRH